MSAPLSRDQFRYTVVSYQGAEKPRMTVHSRHAYDEDATAAAQQHAESSGTAWPNREYPDEHPKHGTYSQGIFVNGNRMAAIYLHGESRYKS